MEELIIQYQRKLANTTLTIQRYLLKIVDWNNRLIAIKGARGTGKTTLLLQYAKENLNPLTSLYVSLDNLYFAKNTLVFLAEEFEKLGGTHLLLDEVHKYPNWSREIKLIYDNQPNLKVIFTSSSMLEIYKSESDLSRRAVSYVLKELSFREFIAFETGLALPSYSFKEIIANHNQIAIDLLSKIKPIPLFLDYLQFGAYPYFKENKNLYYQKLENTINLVIEIDINAVYNISYELIVKLKKLLIAIATSAPFTPNITKLSERIGTNRVVLIEAINQLEKAGLINNLYKNTKGIGALTKPEKIYLNNPNLMYALAKEGVNIGNLRETFFVNQFKELHKVNLAEKGDFLIDDKYTFEVGGKDKSQKQIKDVTDAYLAKDNIEIGVGNIIPVWLFGFMY
jgi:predicted AAA+ superfamily ATPase